MSLQLYPLRAADPGVVIVAGRFTQDTTPTPDTYTVDAGTRMTVTKPATGVYQVAFDASYVQILSAVANVVGTATTGAGFVVQPSVFNSAYVRFTTFAVQSDATFDVADLPDDDGLSFIIVIKNTTIAQS